jgi:adenylate cyclase
VIRKVRLVTGIILFTYVTTHLLNHLLGLISYQMMEEGRVWFLAIWRNPVGTLALYGALLTHFGLALWAIYERRNLRYTMGEAAQITLGIAIPLLLALHVVGTHGAHEQFGTTDNYAYVLLIHFRFATENLYIQTAALLSAWIHGCIGLYYWMRLKPWFATVSRVLFSAALLLPILSLLGYMEGGQDVLALYKDRAWRDGMKGIIDFPDKQATAALVFEAEIVRWIVVGSVLLALAARGVRSLVMKRRGVVRITYPDGQSYSILPGLTLLDASRTNNIPHASVCGGRGRCSTCRVRVVDGFDDLPEPSAEEARVLDRIGAAPQVRLACQTRPTHDISIMPLLPPTAGPREGSARPAYLRGEEREIVILFADLRDFTRFSERKLPYDVVFVLNRYFASMGSSVREAGGHLDKFIGDGVMALFAVESTAADGARQALVAAKLMAQRLEELNQSLATELESPLRIGIGIHVGPVIIGEMGYEEATSLTAVGDSVNTASRLETMTKEYKAQLVVSEAVAELANIDLSKFPSHDVDVRGRSETITARIVVAAADLPVALPGS